MYGPRMQTKKPLRGPVTLASLSSSSIYHLRAACVGLIEDETCFHEEGVTVIVGKVYNHSSSD
jgi:hypothetical protein